MGLNHRHRGKTYSLSAWSAGHADGLADRPPAPQQFVGGAQSRVLMRQYLNGFWSGVRAREMGCEAPTTPKHQRLTFA